MVGFPPPKDKMVKKEQAFSVAPYNRYSYQNMRTFFPTAKVESAKVASKIKIQIDPIIATLKIDDPKTSKPVDMDTYLKESYTDAFVVIKGDKVVYEKYLNGMTPDKPHQMMSVTKSFTGLLGLMAVEEGLVSEDDKISKRVPELKDSTAFNDATFRQVLNMTNSLKFNEDEADPNSDFYEYVTTLLGLDNKIPGKEYADNMYGYLAKTTKEPGLAYGTFFRYQTPKADVLNWVTNKVTKRSFQTYLYDKIWSKIGTDGETYVLLDTAGSLIGGGGLNTTPKNLTRFAMMMLNDGKNTKGEQVVPTSVIDSLAKGGNKDAFSNGPEATGAFAKDWSYRAQWWVRDTKGKEAFSGIGVHGQWLYINKTKNIAIIKQSSQAHANSNGQTQFNLNAFDTIIEALTK